MSFKVLQTQSTPGFHEGVWGAVLPKPQPCPGLCAAQEPKPSLASARFQQQPHGHGSAQSGPTLGTSNSLFMKTQSGNSFSSSPVPDKDTRAEEKHRHCSAGACPVCPLLGFTGNTGRTHTGSTGGCSPDPHNHSSSEPSMVAISLTPADLTSPSSTHAGQSQESAPPALKPDFAGSHTCCTKHSNPWCCQWHRVTVAEGLGPSPRPVKSLKMN